jgi:hypothetical protein
LVLVDLSTRHEAKSLVQTVTFARRIEDHRASARLAQQLIHQHSPDPSALQLACDDDHA